MWHKVILAPGYTIGVHSVHSDLGLCLGNWGRGRCLAPGYLELEASELNWDYSTNFDFLLFETESFYVAQVRNLDLPMSTF